VQLKLKQDSHRDGERGDDANGQPPESDPVTSPWRHLMDLGVGQQSGTDCRQCCNLERAAQEGLGTAWISYRDVEESGDELQLAPNLTDSPISLVPFELHARLRILGLSARLPRRIGSPGSLARAA
jgi:hypothetical protein